MDPGAGKPSVRALRARATLHALVTLVSPFRQGERAFFDTLVRKCSPHQNRGTWNVSVWYILVPGSGVAVIL